MRNRRLLIVDDSAVIRRAVAAAFSDEPGVDVVGTASNGRIALMKIPLLRPDVIVLDVDMPEMDGIETLAAIRRLDPRLPVIILNVSTPLGVAATLGALIHGATDHVTKPDAEVPSDAALRIVGRELVSKVALWCPADVDDRPSHPARAKADVSRRLPKSPAAARVDVLAIGISTGGPAALMDLIPRLPADFPVPILIVQHMPPMFTKLLADRLDATSNIAVAEGGCLQTAAPGHAWIAPGDFHMEVKRDHKTVRIVTHRDSPENSCRPAVDVLFRSVANVYGAHVLAVVMTGMGQDGLRGCEQIQAAGGQILVQDEASSVVWGMPGFVARAGLADQVVPLSRLSDEIIARVSRHRRTVSAVA
jgi:two-component system chemotaxis response regulator CheB